MWGGVGLLILIGAAAGLYFWQGDPSTTIIETPAAEQTYIGVTECRRLPQFPTDWGVSSRGLIGTTLQGFTGFTLSEPPTEADPDGEVLQHETWDDAGMLGPYLLDRNGNIFTAPVPLTSLELNPPAEQNKLYLIDSETGEMSLFLELPAAQTPSTQNPFGVLGLAYDCETNSLYASSVAGSGPTEKVGRIYQIDLDSGEVINQLEGIDAIGIGIFRGAEGKRLYFGAARTPQLFSIALDEAGAFVSEPRTEFSLSEFPGLLNQRIRRVTFTRPNEMEFRTTEFNFSLRIASQPLGQVVTMTYDPAADSWTLLKIDDLALPDMGDG